MRPPHTTRFLIDNALSPTVAKGLREAGFQAEHVRDLNLGAAPDRTIFEHARERGQVVISADTDFGGLLRLSRGTAPSLILFRGGTERRPSQQLRLLAENLPRLQSRLAKGVIAIFEPDRIRLRDLPL